MVSRRCLRRGLGILIAASVGLLPVATSALGQSEAEGLSASFRKASRRALPAVVTVRPMGVPNPLDAIPPVVDAFGRPVVPRPSPREPSGSGVVIDASRGLILTNDHVVQGATRVVVVLANGRERPVKQVWRDPKSDLAMLSVDPGGLVQAEWGDSEVLDTGDWVLAIGQPFGLSGTVTAGIVSGKARGIGIALYEDLIQTDAAINPGNSGGPLVNLKGEIVGINTAIKTSGGGYEGVGFAVPSARARRVSADLAEFGRVRRAHLGVTIRPVDPPTAERLGSNAAVITSLAVAGPAEAAGLVVGDVILRVDGRPVDGPGSLQSLIEVAKVGEPMELTIDRNGASQVVRVRPEPQPDRLNTPTAAGPSAIDVPGPNLRNRFRTQAPVDSEPALDPLPPAFPAPGNSDAGPPVIRSRPSNPDEPPTNPPGPQETAARSPTRFPELGLRLSEPNPSLVRRFRLDRDPRGLFVVGVEPDSPADRGGLEVGMVITDAANRKVSSLPEFREALAKKPARRDLLLRVLKGSKAEFRVLLDPSNPSSEAPATDASAPEISPKLDPLPSPGPGEAPKLDESSATATPRPIPIRRPN